ncbi:MAG TPA: aminotransferase class I/II-fold pyridoxal phosphate-dependent enzyme [Clostridia bacterium]|nr:aminotransferase class I/II-fold pyridoxal phosphate-dependent enzyme [Clostridia bacterium]
MNIPIYNCIKEYIDSNPLPFHMPGHKLGRGIPEAFLNEIARLDLTEIPGTDNLHQANGSIMEAQNLAASAFDADKTFFLVNGSTCGIHAILMSACSYGDKVIVSRDCHKSVINGLLLAGANPVYIKPQYDSLFGITSYIKPSDVEKALRENPDAAGVLITRPNYYGICSDIERIAEITHSYGKLLMVDEAHGAHLIFNRGLPICAMQGGADICVQSAHKTLPALTQGAYLHVKSSRVNVSKLRNKLSMLETSSPSYILMAFLDIARAIMQEKGNDLLEELLDNIQWFGAKLSGLKGLKLLEGEYSGFAKTDRTRIVINVRELGITGYEAEKILRSRFGVQVEMSDMSNIVCISTIADSREHFERLYWTLEGLCKEIKNKSPNADIIISDLPIPKQVIELNKTGKYNGIEIDLSSACSRVSLSVVTPYPPGIPVLCPGELITSEIVEYINGVLRSGGTVNGLMKNDKILVAE